VNTTHLLIATPAFAGQVYTSYMQGMISLIQRAPSHGVDVSWLTEGGDSLVTRARNTLVAQFLKTDCTHLFFIDADIGFDPADVFRMLTADLDVVAGAYPRKELDWDRVADAARRGLTEPDALREAGSSYVVNFPSSTVTVEVTEHGRFAEAYEIGTGFMLIKRQVIEAMIEHYGVQIEYACDGVPSEVGNRDRPGGCVAPGNRQYALFDTAIEAGRYLSEDWLFCHRWRAMGGKVYAALDVKLTHTGLQTWFGNPANRVQPVGGG
jgi:hypothetical protein